MNFHRKTLAAAVSSPSVARAADTSCRPETNLPFFPFPGEDPDRAILTDTPDKVFQIDPSDNLLTLTLNLNTNRHVMRPGIAPVSCPSDIDGIVVRLDRNLFGVFNVMSANVIYKSPQTTVIKFVPINPRADIGFRLRYKFEQNTARTGRDNPRKSTVDFAVFVSTTNSVPEVQYQIVSD